MLGAHLTASIAPQRLAWAPCNPVGGALSCFVIVLFKEFDFVILESLNTTLFRSLFRQEHCELFYI